MQNIMRITVVGAKRYRIDGGVEGCNLFVQSPTEDASGDTVGMEAMQIPAPYAIIDTLRSIVFPAELELLVTMRRGAGGKMGLFCTAANPVPRNPVSGGPASPKV